MAMQSKRASASEDSQHDMTEVPRQARGGRGGRRSAEMVLPGIEEVVQMRVGPGKPGRTKVIQGNPLRMGKDEMNLIEHPFAALWQKEPGDAVIFYQWTATHPDTGRELPASWMVAGHREHGLPTPSDERVYLVLMELTREAAFDGPRVYFSRYDIVRRLGWNNTARSYRMLQGAFDRLKGVTISAKNAFWSPKGRSYINTAFNMVDMYAIKAEPPGRKSARTPELPISYFEWSSVMFDSFQDGYLRTLDLDFALSLSGDIALRLYRYLDKKAYDGRASFEIDLFSLCIGHLGMKPSPYVSKLKERLGRAHDELIAKGFLRTVSFEKGKATKSVKVRYLFAKRPAPADTPALPPAPDARASQPTLPLAAPEAPPHAPPAPEAVAPEPEVLTAEQRELLAHMEAIRVSPEAALDLVRKMPPQALQAQLDCLPDREPRDPAAAFVKSVREMWALPEKYLERKDAQERAEKARAAQESDRARKAAQKAAEGLKRAAAQEDEARLDAMWESLDPAERERLESQARERLGVLGIAGRSQGALLAMRRNLLRQKLGESQG